MPKKRLPFVNICCSINEFNHFHYKIEEKQNSRTELYNQKKREYER
jgi:hypothetical protein